MWRGVVLLAFGHLVVALETQVKECGARYFLHWVELVLRLLSPKPFKFKPVWEEEKPAHSLQGLYIVQFSMPSGSAYLWKVHLLDTFYYTSVFFPIRST
jgi:hypothetical protein